MENFTFVLSFQQGKMTYPNIYTNGRFSMKNYVIEYVQCLSYKEKFQFKDSKYQT